MKRKSFSVKFMGISSTLVLVLFVLFFLIFFTSDGEYSSQLTQSDFSIYIDHLNESFKISQLKKIQKIGEIKEIKEIGEMKEMNIKRIDFEEVKRKCEVTIGMILCEEEDAEEFVPKSKDFSRQINQTLVLLKSILISRGFDNRARGGSCLNVILLSNNYNHYLNITTVVREWNPEFSHYFNISFAPVAYPQDAKWMKRLFRPCATLRLFVPDLLPEIDSMIYLDTDIIFLRGVEELWGEFEGFGESRLAAMAPCLFHYGTQFNRVPFFGPSGLNAGIMLMNLTRFRQTAFSHKLRTIAQIFKNKIRLADQDILNIYFHYFPQHLHVLSCDWNFRPFQCREGSFCDSDQLATEGISALHGNALSFTPKGPEKLFHAVYKTFDQNLNLSKGNMKKELTLFFDTLEFNLEEAEEHGHSNCKTYGAFTPLVLNRLEKIVKKL